MLSKVLGFLKGKKRILGWLLLSIPGVSEVPMLGSALERLLAEPVTGELLATVVAQVVLAAGVLDAVVGAAKKRLQGIASK